MILPPRLCCAVLVATAGCQAPESGSSNTGDTVAITSAHVASAPILRLAKQRDACAPTACEFQSIDIAISGPHGSVVLADFGGVLQQFDSMGRPLRHFGRVGSGPGEYRLVLGAGFDDGGVLTAFDMRQFRIVRFDSTGTPLTTRRVQPSPATFNGAAVGGSHVVWFLLPGAAKIGDPVNASFVALGVGEEDGVDTLARIEGRARWVGDSGMWPLPPFFQAEPQWDVGRDRTVVYAQGDEFRIQRFEPGRRSARVIMGNIPRQTVTAAEIEKERSVRLARARSSPGRAQFEAQVEAGAAAAEKLHPAISSLRLLTDGTLWIRLANIPGADSATYVVFSANNALEGTVTLPARTRVMGGAMSRVLVVVQDSLDVPMARWMTVER